MKDWTPEQWAQMKAMAEEFKKFQEEERKNRPVIYEHTPRFVPYQPEAGVHIHIHIHGRNYL